MNARAVANQKRLDSNIYNSAQTAPLLYYYFTKKKTHLRFYNGPTILCHHLDGGGELLWLDGSKIVAVALIL